MQMLKFIDGAVVKKSDVTLVKHVFLYLAALEKTRKITPRDPVKYEVLVGKTAFSLDLATVLEQFSLLSVSNSLR